MSIDHSYLVTSACAVKVDPDTKGATPYEVDESGAIMVAPDDVIRFRNLSGDGYIPLNALMLHAISGHLKATLNGNEQNVLTVPENASLGISSLAIYSLDILAPCTMRYEGLAM